MQKLTAAYCISKKKTKKQQHIVELNVDGGLDKQKKNQDQHEDKAQTNTSKKVSLEIVCLHGHLTCRVNATQ